MKTLSLDRYRLLGRSGLRVSPVCLGAMTFGLDWGWGSDEAVSRRIFDTYVDRGGNFVDTANVYTNGTSEQLVGKFAEDRRDRLVIATKFTCASMPGDPNSGGNHRKSMMRTVEQSLKRLRTDYIDLLYMHAADGSTPADEIMRGFDDLVRSGKVLYAGISDAPAWLVAQMQTLADERSWAPFVALQIQYNLAERTVERELVPMANALGLGVVPWSPLASGVLTGKYSEKDLADEGNASPGGTRKNVAIGNGVLTAHALRVADVVTRVAREIGTTPARVALAWTWTRAGVTAPIIGARTPEQLEDNLGALDVVLPAEALAALNEASAPALGFPHDFLAMPLTKNVITGGAVVEPRS